MTVQDSIAYHEMKAAQEPSSGRHRLMVERLKRVAAIAR